MSTKCMAWGIDQHTGSATRKLVLLLLCDLADEQLTCYPGRARLADDAELSERAVSSAITGLVEGGFLRVLRRAKRRGGRTSNRYLIMMYGPETPMPDVDDWVSEFATGDETAGQGNSAADAHMPVDDQETAGHGNGEPAAHMPDGDGDDGNGEPGAHSNGHDVPVSYRNSSYPLGVNKDHSSPPPTFTHSDPHVLVAQSVLRQITAGGATLRRPPEGERQRRGAHGRGRRDSGGDGDQLGARLRGMGPLATVGSVYAVLVARLRDVGDPPSPPPSALPFGPWCGDEGCDRTTRRLVDTEGRPRFGEVSGVRVALSCPRCSGR